MNNPTKTALQKLKVLEGINYPGFKLVDSREVEKIIEQLEIDLLNEYDRHTEFTKITSKSLEIP